MNQGNISERFMEIVLKVIMDKKDRFQLKTLIDIIWSIAKLSFTEHENQVKNILKDLQEYPRLVNSLN